MNKKIININDTRIFPFKQTAIATISAYYTLKTKTIKN